MAKFYHLKIWYTASIMIEREQRSLPPATEAASLPPADLEAAQSSANLSWESLTAALGSESYEVAETALNATSARVAWREAAARSSFAPFYRLFEAASDRQPSNIDRLVSQAPALSPRVRDLYLGLASRLSGDPYQPIFDMTQKQLAALESAGDLAVLEDPDVPWSVKLNRMQTRIESELKGRKALDRRDKQMAQSEQEGGDQAPSTPPPDSETSKPSMDEMQRLKEGEQAPAIWTIAPAYGGYFKQQAYGIWDAQKNLWRQAYTYQTVASETINFSDKDTRIISAFLPAGQRTRIPVPYTHIFGGCKDRNENYSLEIDQNGDYVVTANRGREVEIVLQPRPDSQPAGKLQDKSKPPEALNMPCTLSQETEEKLQEIQTTRNGNLAQARALASYTMRRLTYSNDSSCNQLYENDPDGYIGAIDKHKKADCDVANTYFAALCSRLGIPVRHVVGHMVKGKDEAGNSRITSGTGHAWTEIWDNRAQVWVRIDATPPGDPQLEEDDQKGEGAPGDYGEQEDIGPSDEQLRQLEEKLKQRVEALSYTPSERELAQATGIELSEARQIIREIEEAEKITLPNGERVVDVLSQLWLLIAQSRMRSSNDYSGPLRRREGGESITNLVAHSIGIMAGEVDPRSREKDQEIQLVEQVMSALQLRIIADKSGSMSNSVEGEVKWQLQRRAEYLIFSSLDRAQKTLSRLSSRMEPPLNVYTQGISFRNSDTIDVDKPLSPEFELKDKVTLWRSLGNQGWGNGDVAALQHVYDEIKEEEQKLAEAGEANSTLRVVIACSDGEPDDPLAVSELAEALGQLDTVVIGIGLTEAAAKVPLIFTTPHSRGDLARDLNDLPAIVAKHVVSEALKLFPERAKRDYQKQITALLAKFDRLGNN